MSRLIKRAAKPARFATRENIPLELFIENISGPLAPGSTGKPEINASTETGR